MPEIKSLDRVALGFIVAGGLNWGIAGLFSLDILNKILRVPALQNVVYALVGVAAIYTVYGTLTSESI